MDSVVGIVLLVAGGALAFLVLVVWSIKRHRDPRLRLGDADSIEELIPSIAGLTLSSAVAGNSVEVFENGAFFDVLIE
jgi:cardiolipin synthase